MTRRHTPTPWKQLGWDIIAVDRSRQPGDLPDFADIATTAVSDWPVQQCAANAAFVVRAVNHFDSMLKGLQMAARRLADIQSTTGIDSDEVTSVLQDIIAQASDIPKE